jgi:hypothetical protein
MTRLAEQLVERFKAMSDTQQDEWAAFWLSELDDDERWAASTVKGQDKLDALSDRLWRDKAEGLTEPLDPDRL